MAIKFLPLIILFTALSGCSSLVAQRISNQTSYDYSWFITDEELRQKGYTKERYCSVQNGLCLSYLLAPPARTRDRFAFEMVVNGDPIQLQLRQRDLPARFKGTIVLLHGFAISKEYMAMTASYFRFLGFNVIVPDLLGHGESEGAITFGTRDSELIAELLSQQRIEQPLLVFGNSMGALPAVTLAANRDDIDGVILQAPMMPFDLAAFNYIRFDSPLLASLVTEGSIRKGAVKALQQVQVPLAKTDIRPIVSALDVPVLVLTSSSDIVSPYSYFKPLESRTVSVVDVQNRNHYSMVVLDQSDSRHILEWLQEFIN